MYLKYEKIRIANLLIISLYFRQFTIENHDCVQKRCEVLRSIGFSNR